MVNVMTLRSKVHHLKIKLMIRTSPHKCTLMSAPTKALGMHRTSLVLDNCVIARNLVSVLVLGIPSGGRVSVHREGEYPSGIDGVIIDLRDHINFDSEKLLEIKV